MYVGMYITQSFEWRGTHCASVTEQVVARVRLRPLMLVAACCRDRDQQTQLHETPVWRMHYAGAPRCAVDLQRFWSGRRLGERDLAHDTDLLRRK